MTNSFSNRSINNIVPGQSADTPAASTKEVHKPDRLKPVIIYAVVSTIFAILSLAIMSSVLLSIPPKEDMNGNDKPPSSSSVIAQQVDSCQGERLLLHELGDLCHDARSSNGPVLKCNVVGRNALMEGSVSIGNAYMYGNNWEVLTVFRPCDPERKEPVVSLSVLKCGQLTNVTADEQSLSGVNKSYVITHDNMHYGVADDTRKTLNTYVDASFFSTTQNGITEMHLLVTLNQDCWPGATREQCSGEPIIVKNQVCQAATVTAGIWGQRCA